MQKFDRTHTIQIGIWTRSSGAIRIYGTYYTCSSNYEHDRMRRATVQVESTNDHGRK
jgi:hypothetical protein